MIFTQPKRMILGGQEVIYNADAKVLRFTIESPFRIAGSILKWPKDYGKPGLGINDKIFKFIQDYSCILVIHITSEKYDCRINYDNFKHFVKYHNTSYEAKGNHLNVIPISLTIGIPGAKD